ELACARARRGRCVPRPRNLPPRSQQRDEAEDKCAPSPLAAAALAKRFPGALVRSVRRPAIRSSLRSFEGKRLSVFLRCAHKRQTPRTQFVPPAQPHQPSLVRNPSAKVVRLPDLWRKNAPKLRLLPASR